MVDFTYPAMLSLFPQFRAPQRSDSAAFLIWYLMTYYRLDEIDAVDCVCDQSGDKGVDGIYINEAAGTIDVFQSKISQKAGATIGDVALKSFFGTLAQFAKKEAVQQLVKSAGNAQVANLIKALDLEAKIGHYEIRGIFVTNASLDHNGAAFLALASSIEYVGLDELQARYVSAERDTFVEKAAVFDTSAFQVTTYTVEDGTKAIIAPVSARELVALEGIENQSLFSLNVRGPLPVSLTRLCTDYSPSSTTE